MSIITCPEGVARVVYQGELKPGSSTCASLPLPAGGLNGNIASRPPSATPRRPIRRMLPPTPAPGWRRCSVPTTRRSRTARQRRHERLLRHEEVRDRGRTAFRHGQVGNRVARRKSMRGTSLKNPVFDIHYNAREAGGQSHGRRKIRYALIITVEAPKHVDLYNEILRAYAKNAGADPAAGVAADPRLAPARQRRSAIIPSATCEFGSRRRKMSLNNTEIDTTTATYCVCLPTSERSTTSR